MIRRKEGIEMKKGLKSLVLLGSISLVGFGLVGCNNIENVTNSAKSKIEQAVGNDDQVIKKALNRKYNYSDYSIKETLETLAKYRGISTKVHARLVDNKKKVKCWIGKEDEYDENYLCMYIMADTGKIYEIDDATVRVDITDPENLGQYEAENFEGWDTADDTTDGEYSGEGLDNADYDGSDEDYPDEDVTNESTDKETLNKIAKVIQDEFNSIGYNTVAYVSGSSVYARVTVSDITRQDLIDAYASSEVTDDTIKSMLGIPEQDLKDTVNYGKQQGYDISEIAITFLTKDGSKIATCSSASGWQVVHY